MGRRAMLNAGQVEAIRASTKTLAELATEYETTTLTVGKVKRFQGAYKHIALELGDGWVKGSAEDFLSGAPGEQIVPFDPPVHHE